MNIKILTSGPWVNARFIICEAVGVISEPWGKLINSSISPDNKIPNPVFNFPIKELDAYINPCWPKPDDNSTSSLISPNIDSRIIAEATRHVEVTNKNGAVAKKQIPWSKTW